ncbi:MAG: GlsB/YeaQ/YmgE family stress response membrane protein [Zetaproteobacteria bacterium]|nr:MAG: GlsB/YeaQ/YmgE family stress response membrane protein [Zetaproteobacteria bacterium]
MTLQLVMMWVLVGLSAGWLARYFVKDGGYGLVGDLALGLAGSIVASLVFRAIGISPGAALVVWVIIAAAGAVLGILAQRMFWHAHA